MTQTPDPELLAYLEAQILPRYAAFDRAHGIDHVRTVIARSLSLAERFGADPNMACAIAAYHDTGLCAGRERHQIVSAELLAADRELARWFSPAQVRVMCEAVEDHRASSARPPRSLYGRIVAEADRCIDPATILRRTVQYGLDNCPALGREEQYLRCREHLQRKYGDGGYLRLWIEEPENARRLEELRALIRDEKRLRARFDALYDRETASKGTEPQRLRP